MKSIKSEIIEFLKEYFPTSLKQCEIEKVEEKGATLIWKVSEADIRPGGTIAHVTGTYSIPLQR